MRVARGCSSTVCEVDGKIYVAGGCKEDIGSLYWIEVFDPKTQTWGTLKNPCIEYQNDIGYRCEVKSLGLDGKIYMFGSEFVVYNFEEDRWKCIGRDKYNLYHAVDPMSRINSSSCVVDNVLFILDKGTRVFKWYDFKVSLWKELNGVEGLPDLSDRGYVKMVDLGGKIAVLWQECLTNKKIKRICVLRLALKDAMEMRFGGRLSGLIMCLVSTRLFPCSARMLFPLLFDEMGYHEIRLERLIWIVSFCFEYFLVFLFY